MGSAKSIVNLIDLSATIKSFPGVRAGMLIRSKFGSLDDEPVLVTDEEDLLNNFTSRGKIAVGDSIEYFSALTYLKMSNALYLKRVAVSAYYGGAVIKSTGTDDNAPFEAVVTASVFTLSTGNASVSTDLYGALVNGYTVTYTVSGGSAPTGITHNGVYYVKKGTSPVISLHPTKDDALANTNPITIGTLGAGTHTLTYTTPVGYLDPTAYDFGDDDCMILYAANPGVWNNNDVVVKLIDNSSVVPDTFYVKVYRPENTNVPIDGEEFLCSRKSFVDGYDNQLFIEDVLLSSRYIRAINNDLVDDDVLPTFTDVETDETISFAGGTNGDPITEDDMILAIDSFSDKDSIQIAIFMDGGFAVPTYAAAIAELCEARKDCFGILSVPYSVEVQSNYMSTIPAYRDSLTSLLPDRLARFVALYTSHQQIRDKFNKRNIFIAPDGFAGATISYTAFNLEIWYGNAGWENGGISAIKPLIKFKEGQRDLLYDKGINPIRYSKVKGLAIWGNRNLQVLPSSLNRVNVMLLIITLIPAIQDLLDNKVFKLNIADDRRRIVILIDQYMLGIQSDNGVTEFAIKDKTTPLNETEYKSKYALAIKPVGLQEFIDLDLAIVKANDSIKVGIEG